MYRNDVSQCFPFSFVLLWFLRVFVVVVVVFFFLVALSFVT